MSSGASRSWRQEIRDWLATNAPAKPLADPYTEEGMAEHKAWEKTLAQAGYGAIHWPVEYGGRDATLEDRLVFTEEYERANGPERINIQGLSLVGPTLMKHGNAEQRARWIPRILSCDDLWCQAFSEPGAGSDLAALSTRAVRVGDEFVVSGQKTWSSYGTFADWIFALVRTSPTESRHRGITCLMIDITSPGIEVRPIRQANGAASFAEIFFDDVKVPVANVVGSIDGGWAVAMSTLATERGVARRTYISYLSELEELVAIARQTGHEPSTPVTQNLGRILAEILVYRDFVNRNTLATGPDGDVGPEASLNKLYWSHMRSGIYDYGVKLLASNGESLIEDQHASWVRRYWHGRASRIYGGTDQIQRTIIAERVLGLPRAKAK